MTKERVTVHRERLQDRGVFHDLEWAAGLFLSSSPFQARFALSFVIPERTRISCHAALETTSCAAFSKESRMKFANATNTNRKSGAA
jgi:hypothetical protein